MGKIIRFKTKQQLETENVVRVMREWEVHLEWEEANWHHVVDREAREEESLSQEEIEWLNDWAKENDSSDSEVVKGNK